MGTEYAITGHTAMNLFNMDVFGIEGYNNKTYSKGLLEIHFGKNGVSTALGSGGVDMSYNKIANAVAGMEAFKTQQEIRQYDASGETDYADDYEGTKDAGTALRSNYSFGEEEGRAQLEAILDGTDKLKVGYIDHDGQTTLENGGRVVNLATLGQTGDLNSQLAAGVVLGHEAYRDGIIGSEAEQNAEALRAVNGHTEMAKRIADDGYGYGFILNNDNLRTDLKNYAAGEEAFRAYVGETYDSTKDYWKLMNDGGIVWDGERDLRNEAGEVIRVDKTKSFSKSLMNWFGEDNTKQLLADRGIDIENLTEAEIAYQLMKTSGVKWDGDAINTVSGKTGSYVPINQEYEIGSTLVGMEDMLRFQLSDDEAFNLGKISQESPDIAYYVDGPNGAVNVMASSSCFFMSTLGGVQTQAGKLLTADQINKITELSLVNSWLETDDESIWPNGAIARKNISQLAFAELGQFGFLDFSKDSTGTYDGSLMVGDTSNGNNHAREGNAVMEEVWDPYEAITYTSDGYLNTEKSEYYNYVDYQEYYWQQYMEYYR